NKIRTCTILTHHLYRLNKCFSGTEPSGLVVSDRENIQGRHHLTSLRVRWISVAAASSGSASPTVDENYRSVRVTTRTPSVKNSSRHAIVGRTGPNKMLPPFDDGRRPAGHGRERIPRPAVTRVRRDARTRAKRFTVVSSRRGGNVHEIEKSLSER